MGMDEKVLCFKTEELDKLGKFQGFSPDLKYMKLLSPDLHFYANRSEAEVNPAWKQLIPYIVLRDHRSNIFRYQRTKKVGEQRLASRFSVGVGGHLKYDDKLGKESPLDGANRELQEELEIFDKVAFKAGFLHPDNIILGNNDILGFINDDSDEVGAVHFGLCLQVYLPDYTGVRLREEALVGGGFDRPKDVAQLDLESWSKIVLGFLRGKYD
jgi:predicted NUDIX family phosphoesterase